MNSEERVSSTRNPLVRRFRAAAQGEPPDVVVADGFHLSTEALTAGLRLVAFAWSPKLRQRDDGETLLQRLRQTAAQEHACTDRVLAQLSSLKTHQGVVALLQRPNPALADLVKGDAPLLVVAAEVQDPGNLGALVRSAEAAALYADSFASLISTFLLISSPSAASSL